MKNISAVFAKYFKFLNYGEQLHPWRDWYVLLGITILLGMVSVLWNVYYFNQSVNQEQKETTVTVESVTNTTVVDSVNAYFEKRAQEVERYAKEYTFIDPSGKAK